MPFMPFILNINLHKVPLYFAYRRTSRNKRQFNGTFHAHHGIEIMFIHQGKGSLILEQKTYGISPGTLCFFQPFQLHHIQVDLDESPFIRTIVHFEPSLYEAYFEKWPSLHRFFKMIHTGKFPSQCFSGFGERPDLNELCRSLHEIIPRLTKNDYFEEFSLFLVSFFRVLKQIWENHELLPLHDLAHEVHHSDRILQWINRHYAEPFDLKRMARDLHISPFHLSHLFKENTGSTISDYIAAFRLRQAILLLTTSDRSVAEIGEAVGLTNSSYFCKFFKEQMGITPYQYRKRMIAERF